MNRPSRPERITRDERAGQPRNSATTVMAISAVPTHPKKVSVGQALKDPPERRVTTIIMIVMIGTATIH
jgi:hypothetical protein